MHTLYQQTILDWAYLFHWAESRDFVRAIAPDRDRLKGVEYNLPVLVKKRKLKQKKIDGFGNKLFYALPGTNGTRNYTVLHGLKCTDALVRFHLSEEGEYISEREFRAQRFDPVPEFAVRYNEGKPVILLFEYSTVDNFRRKKLIENKLKKYGKLEQFRREYDAEPYLVFVIDAHQDSVKRFARKHSKKNFYFTDANRFYAVPYGQQLSRPIYYWMGEEVALDA